MSTPANLSEASLAIYSSYWLAKINRQIDEYKKSLKIFDFYKDERTIGKPQKLWNKLKRLRNGFKLMVSPSLKRRKSNIPRFLFERRKISK